MPPLSEALDHHQNGRLQEAELIYRQILAADPTHADAWHLLGVIAHQLGNHGVAVEYIGRALTLNPSLVPAHTNLGIVYQVQEDPGAATACYRRALELQPNSAKAHYNLGNALRELHNHQEAILAYRNAIALDGRYWQAYSNLGAALRDQSSLAEAEASIRRAIEIQPGDAQAYYRLGNVLHDMGKLDEAVDYYRRALQLKPNVGEAYSNLATSLLHQAKYDDATACFERSLHQSRDLPEARWNLSMLMLLQGDFERGWPEYEWRWKVPPVVLREFPQPKWTGQPIRTQTILLHAEQGLGDTIQFIRYAALVRDRAGAVIVECQAPLKNLLASCPGIDRLIGQGEEPPSFDCHISLVSLPGLFNTTLASIPAEIPYMSAPPDLIEDWHQRLSSSGGLRVGIAWQGNPTYRADPRRSIPLQQFGALAKVSGVRLISLQKRPGVDQLTEAHELFPIVDFGTELDEAHGAFMDTAAIMKNLDLVITSDSAVAHLAGALGVPVWLALPYVPDWRWLLDRTDSPWYPTMRLFRQKTPGDWAGVFTEIESALRQLVASKP